jgi:hypothetical protein
MLLMELGKEFKRAWMKAVAILITYCKSLFDENLLYVYHKPKK